MHTLVFVAEREDESSVSVDTDLDVVRERGEGSTLTMIAPNSHMPAVTCDAVLPDTGGADDLALRQVAHV